MTHKQTPQQADWLDGVLKEYGYVCSTNDYMSENGNQSLLKAKAAIEAKIAERERAARIATMHDYQVKRTAHRLIKGNNADGEVQFVNSYIKELE